MGAAPDGTVRVIFLGGLGEVGRNCCAIEVNGRLMLVDVGLMCPDSDMPGIDLVLPDFTYLRDNADRIDGAILTHGHEDHVGGLSYLLRDISFPLYATQLTLNLARGRIEEAGLLGRTSFKKGDVERARSVNARLLDSYSFETGDANPNPQPVKAMLRTLGHPVGYCRPPMDGEPDDLEDRARKVYADLKAGS